MQRVLLDVRAPPGADQLVREGLLQRGHNTRLDQRLGDVRANDVPALGDLSDALERDGVAQLLKLGHHALAPGVAILPQAL